MIIYNETKWLRAIINSIPYVGSTFDMLFYKKGIETDKFVAGEILNEGDNCYLNIEEGKFYKASSGVENTSSTMIVKSLQRIQANKKGVFLIKGKYYTQNLRVGILYLSDEPGQLTSKVIMQTGQIQRIISYALSDKIEFFNPDHSFIEFA